MDSFSSDPPSGRSPSSSVRITRGPQDESASSHCFSDIKTPSDAYASAQQSPLGSEDDLGLPSIEPIQTEDSGDWADWDTVDPALIRFTLDEPHALSLPMPSDRMSLDVYRDFHTEQSPTPFHRWMRTLRRRGLDRRAPVTDDEPMPRPFSSNGLPGKPNGTCHHRQSSSGSSFGFVETVKTASASLASGSIFARSRRNSMMSSRSKTHTDLSSRASMSSNRCSEDSAGLDKPHVLDKATLERSLQRRRILEELISTEEGYIGDVRFLMNVYVTILVSLPTMPSGLRSSINRNLADIIELHEELLGELHRAVPHSEYTQVNPRPRSKHHAHGHHRIRSLDVVLEDDGSMSWLETVPGMVAEPNVVADVAQIFTKKV
ncbi:hypothetical protein Daus18300_002047 [Diaporthe australafricana]|uniref:DH domain-containing protein n=1 Tax=Diaporthe australafricana TaxID=127596 RepID=A0ABR3XSQ6_9PEZI